MQKLLIRATHEVAYKLEEKLRHRYDIQVYVLDDNIANVVCEILAKVRRKWVTICRFVPYENLDDILTMFRVNFELRTRRL
ncbi:MAG: hypothetical protein WBW34_12050 [Nitrososphaeraceae archaeon]